MPQRLVRLAPLAMLLMWVSPLHARTFCCETTGKTYCDEGIPAACYGKAYRELNGQGVTVRHYAAPLTPEQQAKKEAEQAKLKEEERLRLEAEQRDRKLIGTYATLGDLQQAHERMLADMDKGKQQLEQRLGESEKRKQQLEAEAEFYKKKPLPSNLKAQISDNATDIQGQKKNIATRVEEIENAKKRFSEERTRYESVTGQRNNLR